MATETVKFDVGGTKYRVARSLIERFPETVLARMVSNTWQDDPDKEIFIERDGLRFSCVLDYMRDKKVHVPVNTTKASVLQDLEYFGFGEIPDDAIEVRSANVSVGNHLASLESDIKNLSKNFRCEIVAHLCFKKYFLQEPNFSRQPKSKYVNVLHSDLPEGIECFVLNGMHAAWLNPHLKKYGLLCRDFQTINNGRRVQLEELKIE